MKTDMEKVRADYERLRTQEEECWSFLELGGVPNARQKSLLEHLRFYKKEADRQEDLRAVFRVAVRLRMRLLTADDRHVEVGSPTWSSLVDLRDEFVEAVDRALGRV